MALICVAIATQYHLLWSTGAQTNRPKKGANNQCTEHK